MVDPTEIPLVLVWLLALEVVAVVAVDPVSVP